MGARGRGSVVAGRRAAELVGGAALRCVWCVYLCLTGGGGIRSCLVLLKFVGRSEVGDRIPGPLGLRITAGVAVIRSLEVP